MYLNSEGISPQQINRRRQWICSGNLSNVQKSLPSAKKLTQSKNRTLYRCNDFGYHFILISDLICKKDSLCFHKTVFFCVKNLFQFFYPIQSDSDLIPDTPNRIYDIPEADIPQILLICYLYRPALTLNLGH